MLKNERSIILYFASDHAGYELRLKLVSDLKQIQKQSDDLPQPQVAANHHINFEQLIDLGTHNSTPCDYPDYANLLAQHMKQNSNNLDSNRKIFGVLLCGSGIGISIAANRHKHLRAALCNSVEYARLARAHNDANVLVLGSRFVGKKDAVAMIKTFITTDFEQGRHGSRVAKLSQ